MTTVSSLFLFLLFAAATAYAQAVRFTDVATAAGVTFVHRAGAQGGWHYVETMGSGCALFDYDGDGDLDLYLVNGANLPGQPPEGTNVLYRNDRKSFTAEGSGAGQPGGLTVGRKNAEKNAEKIKEKGEKPLTTHHSPLTTRSREAEGGIVFTDVTQQAGVPGRGYGMGCAVGDYDNDGDPDLYVTGYPENVLYRNELKGEKTSPSPVAGERRLIPPPSPPAEREGVMGVGEVRPSLSAFVFTDVTRQAGVAVGGWSSGAAFFDYDGDGYLDLFVVSYLDYDLRREPPCERVGVRTYCDPAFFNGARSHLYRNNRDGTFTEVSPFAGITDSTGKGMGVVTLDYNGDGDTDVYVANDTTPNFLYRNDKRNLTAKNAKNSGVGQPGGLTVGGKKSAEKIRGGEGKGSVINPKSREGGRSSESSGEDVRNPQFVEVGLEAGVAYSGEGKAQASMGVDAGDYDNDGDEDLIVTNFSYETNALYRNDGGIFIDTMAAAGLLVSSLLPLGFGVNFLDYDNDGDLDLFVANGHIFPNVAAFSAAESYAQRSQLFRNDGGVFREVRTEAGIDAPGVGRGSAVGDIDGDGDLDVVVVNSGGRPRIWRNDGGNRKHWLMVKLIGGMKAETENRRKGAGPHLPPAPSLSRIREREGVTSDSLQRRGRVRAAPHSPTLPLSRSVLSNRDGIGARVFVTAGGRTQMREVRSQSSYLSVSDVRPHFGLGSADRVERVEVRWPGGQVQRLSDVQADRVVVIEENLNIEK